MKQCLFAIFCRAARPVRSDTGQIAERGVHAASTSALASALGCRRCLRKTSALKRHECRAPWHTIALALLLSFIGAALACAQQGPGNALRFDGGADNVTVSHTNALNAFPLTVTCWLRTTQSAFGPGVINKLVNGTSNGWEVFTLNGEVRARYMVDGSNSLSGSTGLASALNGGFVADNVFHHVAFTVDAAGGRLHVDGVLRDSRAWIGTPGAPTTSEVMRLGFMSGRGQGSFIGTLDEVTVWNVALTQAEIQANMHRGLAGTEPGLVAYYRFNESSGSTTADSAPAGGDNQGFIAGPTRILSGIVFVPTVTTLNASNIILATATLNGSANPNNANTSAWFEWGASTNYGNVTSPQPLGSANAATNFSQVLTGLFGGVYHFRAVASNSFGVVLGGNQSFTMPLFALATTNLTGVEIGAAAWGDRNNDGRLDILLMGAKTIGVSVEAHTAVWTNTGSGFVQVGNQGELYDGSAAWADFGNDGRLDSVTSGFGILFFEPPGYFTQIRGFGTNGLTLLTGVAQSSVAAGDFDNDGRLDFLLAGNDSNTVARTELWRNVGNDFAQVNASLPGVADCSVAWGDYDNDGRLDILLTGSSSNGAIAEIWRNTGAGFTNINAGLPGIESSSAAWGDFDNDGRLDILLAGMSGNGRITELWRNTGSGFTNVNAGLPGVSGGSATWGDYDSDGRLDILLTGTSSNGAIAQLWRNTGSGFINVQANLPAVSNGGGDWADYDNDGRLDILLHGRATNGTRITQVWRNNTPLTNTPPSAPTGLAVATAGDTITFSWNAASDSQTPAPGLTYNLRVGTTPGGFDLVGPMAASNGFRRVPQMGNAQHSLSRIITGLPLTQPIYWSVQAVDTAFAGSVFAPEQVFAHNTVLTPTNGVPVAGDTNGDGAVDQSELAAVLQSLNGNGVVSEANLNLILSNYFSSSPFLQVTNVAGLGGTNVTFALTNDLAGAFSVEYSTNLMDWLFLGPATPRYEFTDTNAPAEPQRHYRLRWP